MSSNLLLEFDLVGAEWVVVAYVSGDPTMIGICERGENPHLITGCSISGAPKELVAAERKLVGELTDPVTIADMRTNQLEGYSAGSSYFWPRNMSIYQMGKKSDHGLNYDEAYKTFALKNEIDEVEARRIIKGYHETYPGIRDSYHQGVRDQLRKDRIITNCFGMKRKFLDAWGGDLFRAAYAQNPQSTVVHIINQAMVKAFANDSTHYRKADLLMQVHDALDWQYPTDSFSDMAKFCIDFGLRDVNPLLRWKDREFRIGTDLKVGLDWGHMWGVKLIDDLRTMTQRLRDVYQELLSAKSQEAEAIQAQR